MKLNIEIFYQPLSMLFKIAALIISLFTGAFLLFFVGRGFDLSDNGYYLLSIDNYHNITADLSLSHGLLRHLYYLAGQDVMLFRILGALLMLILGIVLAYWILRGVSESKKILIPALCAGTSSVLYYATFWLTTPSYNWLSVIGAMCIVLGLVLGWILVKKQGIGPFLIGSGLVILAWGKVTAFILMIPLLSIILLTTHLKFRKIISKQTIIAFALGFGFMLFLGLIQEASINQMFSKQLWAPRLQNLWFGEERTYHLLVRHPLQEVMLLGRYLVRTTSNILSFAVVGYLFSGFINYYFSSKYSSYVWYLTELISISLVLKPLFSQHSVGVGGWSISLYTVILFITVIRWIAQHYHLVDYLSPFPKHALGISLLLAIFPLIVTYGSGGGYLTQFGMASFFYILAAIVLVTPFEWIIREYSVLLMIIAVAFTLITNSQNVYRQNSSVQDMTVLAPLQFGKSHVLVNEPMADYLTTLQDIAQAHEFVPSTPVIDLTGHSPGAIYALDGVSYGYMWLAGGYEKSDEASLFILQNLWPVEALKSAWVLTVEENPRRPLSVTILAEVGLNFPDDYVSLGSFTSHLDETHTLWKPKS